MLWHRELAALNLQHSEHGKRIKELRRNIEAALNGATFGGLPDGTGVYTNKHQTRREYHVEEAVFTSLRFVKACNWDAEKQYGEKIDYRDYTSRPPRKERII